MVFLKQSFLIFASALALCCAAGPASADPTLAHRSISENILAGQKVKLILALEWPAQEGELQFAPPEESLPLNNIKFLALKRSLTNEGRISRLTLVYELLPLKAGQGTIESFNLHYRAPGMTRWRDLPIPKITLDIKPGLPWKTIGILLLLLAAIVIPSAIWLVMIFAKENRVKGNIRKDPKQQMYADAARSIDGFIGSFDQVFLKKCLTSWTDQLKKVVMTRYGIPVRPATGAEILKELDQKKIPVDEINEVTDLFNRIARMRFSTEIAASQELDKLQHALLQYIRSKMITENPDLL
jgi:hypothetical protein